MGQNEDYNPTLVRTGVYKLKEGARDKNLILIHGLHGDGAFNREEDQMRDFYLALLHSDANGSDGADGASPALADYTVWTLTYNTVLMPFDISGSWLADELKKITDYDFTGAIVVGYSMGGLIGRVLVTKGFNFKYLITIDTPHEGPLEILNAASWFLFFCPMFATYLVHGIDSLMWGSGSQRLIHDNELDKAKRKTSYAFYATDIRKNKDAKLEGGDDVVPVHSQLSVADGDVRWRAVWEKVYEDGAWQYSEAHSKASRPHNCKDVLDLVRLLLKGEPMPERKIDGTPASAKAQTASVGAGKPPLSVEGWNAWYRLDKHDNAHMRIALQVQNQDAKPFKLPLTQVMHVQGGDVRAIESVAEIMLPPKAVRKLVFAVDRPIKELLPEELEAVSFGERRTLKPLFMPFDVDPAAALPTESCWQAGLELGAVSASQSEDGYFTEVTVPMTIENPSASVMYLDHEALDIRIDVTDEPFYGFVGHSDVRDDKRVRLAPGAKTPLTAVVQWPGGVGKPNKVLVRLGGSAMPAAQSEAEIAG
ncbi:MAG: hypothetical protein E6Q88_03650 [Lysobacteraceae bacterium]|nr:MAG: hypothetical protein E6Q88_03650 [Xanthomonadaceae bacterium]